jgi:glycosyltransferase involved in cell wall biosynthesis
VKVAFVVPRYGAEIRGGAEVGARMLAERLVADRGYEVEVLTTCALDAITWRDELPSGTSVERGVTVHRICSAAGRNEHFHPLWAQLMVDPGAASAADCAKWVAWQGPLAPDLVEAVAASDADVVAFYPYLYYPTVYGLPLVRDRAVLHPAAHEEPALHLPVFDELFRSCRGFAFHSRSERALVNARFGVASTPQVLIGLGVEEPGVPEEGGVGGGAGGGGGENGEGSAEAVRSAFGLGAGDAPYVVCIGRVDDQKGTGMLWRWFRSYKQRHPGPLQLVFVGQVVNAPEEAAEGTEGAADIVLTGMVDDVTKWALLRGARALVAPSPHESFSLTVVEALTASVPVLVHAQCGATREHCERSGAGLWFGDFAEFESALEVLVTDDVLHARLAANGVRYVDANFRWSVILDRYCAFLERFTGTASVAAD